MRHGVRPIERVPNLREFVSKRGSLPLDDSFVAESKNDCGAIIVPEKARTNRRAPKGGQNITTEPALGRGKICSPEALRQSRRAALG
jgi:hypothetical protein